MVHFIFSVIEEEDDRQFMTEIYRQYSPLMKRKAYQITKDYSIMDDLIQEACVKLIPQIPKLRSQNGCQRTCYIVATIRNISFDHLRKKLRYNQYSHPCSLDSVMYQLVAPQVSPEHYCIVHETNMELANTLDTLCERDRQLLIYKYYLGYTGKEIAQLMGIPVRHIHVYLSRARRRALCTIAREQED